jgi:glucose dehydrogenase
MLTAWLGAAPLVQVLSLADLRAANFAPGRPWYYVAYGLAAPYVAWLIWRRHPRARFAAYVLLTHEAVRGVHFERWGAVALAALWILLLQLPAARRWLPSLNPGEMRARWRRRLATLRGRRAGADASDRAVSDAPSRDAPRRLDSPSGRG